jgi:hypothetical protein
MKKITLIAFLVSFYGNIVAQSTNQILYLIYDKNTPVITKDISKYLQYNEPIIGRLAWAGKVGNYGYTSTYPLFAGVHLDFDIKPGTTPQTIPISQVSSYNAKTIAQLDQELQPKVLEDFNNVLISEDPWQSKTYQYFMGLSKIYVIELLSATQQAVIVEVVITSKL